MNEYVDPYSKVKRIIGLCLIPILIAKFIYTTHVHEISETAPDFDVNHTSYWLFYTIQSNILVIIFLIFNTNPFVRRFRLAIVTMITITMIVYWAFIFPFMFSGSVDALSVLFNIHVHLIVPAIALIAFFKGDFVDKRHVNLYLMIHGALYLTAVFIYGAKYNHYPYPFLDGQNYGWDLVVFATIFGAIILNTVPHILYRLKERAWDES